MVCNFATSNKMLWQSLRIMLVAMVVGLAGPSWAALSPVTWTEQTDFENNAATTGTPTTRVNIDTSTTPGNVKIGVTKDFVTTATITCISGSNKIYTTGVERTSIAVVNSATKTVTTTIPLPGRAAGVVFNSANNKLYVGQFNDNKVLVIDVGTDTIIHTLTVGNGAYAAAYNSTDNKVYIANTDDQTVTILDGGSDSALTTLPVAAGATTASFDAVADKIYLTSKANQYMTIIDGATDQVVQDVEISPVANLLGGQAPGNIGLRVDAPAKGISSANALHLSWNYDTLGSNQNIQLQVRTATDVPSLDNAIYKGPDGTADTWYELSTSGAVTTTETDGTKTTSVTLNAPYTPAAEVQLKLSSDGLSTPVMHLVTLGYESYPDLVTASISGPTTGTIGNSLSISSAVTNQEGVAAASFKVGLYLTKNGTDYFLGDRTVASLAAEATDSASTTVTIPTIPTGNYTLKACADYTNMVNEGANENNNCKTENAISVSSVQADLVITAVSGPTSVGTGHTFSTTVTVKNRGLTAAPGFTVYSYLSTDNIITGSDSTLASRVINGLAAGAEQTVTITGPISPNFTPGTYYLGAIADVYNSVNEADKTNNWLAGNQVVVNGSDLVITAVSGPTSVGTGHIFSTTVTVKNQGLGDAPGFNVYSYLSTDNVITGTDSTLALVGINGLAAGAEQTVTITGPISPNFTPGTYYLGAIADFYNSVKEADETNNWLAGNQVVVGP